MAGRRPNGDGTIKKRANGIYEGRLTLSDGTRKSIYGKKLDDVLRQLDAAKHDRDKGLPVLHGKCQTVASFLATWLEMK